MRREQVSGQAVKAALKSLEAHFLQRACLRKLGKNAMKSRDLDADNFTTAATS